MGNELPVSALISPKLFRTFPISPNRIQDIFLLLDVQTNPDELPMLSIEGCFPPRFVWKSPHIIQYPVSRNSIICHILILQNPCNNNFISRISKHFQSHKFVMRTQILKNDGIPPTIISNYIKVLS